MSGGTLLTRDAAALAAGLLLPLAVTAVLIPLRSSWSNTNVALVLVVAVVAVAAIGCDRFPIAESDGIRTAVHLLMAGAAVSQLARRGQASQVCS